MNVCSYLPVAQVQEGHTLLVTDNTNLPSIKYDRTPKKHIDPSTVSRFYSSLYIIHDDVIRWNIFRVTGPLCGEFTGHRWIPRTKANDAVIWDAIVLIKTSM